MSSAIVLATTAENAEALLSGERDRDHRRFPPKKLPARAPRSAIPRKAGLCRSASRVAIASRARSPTSGWKRFHARSGTSTFDQRGGSCPGYAGLSLNAPSPPCSSLRSLRAGPRGTRASRETRCAVPPAARINSQRTRLAFGLPFHDDRRRYSRWMNRGANGRYSLCVAGGSEKKSPTISPVQDGLAQ